MNGNRRNDPQKKLEHVNGNGSGNGRKRYRVSAPVERDGLERPRWPRLGTGFENEPKDGRPPTITVKLDAHPMGDTLILFEDDGRDAAAA